VEAREQAGGRFRDVMDFFERLDYKRVNKRVVESLVKAGALDGFGHARARLFAALEAAMGAGQQEQDRKASGQMGLFGGAAAAGPTFQLPNVAEWPVGEKMKLEKEALGLFLTGHPVQDYDREVERFASATIGGLRSVAAETKVAVCGMVASLRVIKTKKGDKMAFVALEDLDGTVECVFFPKSLAASQAALAAGKPILVHGVVEQKPDGAKILADSVELMEDVRERNAVGLRLRVSPMHVEEESLKQLQAMLERDRGERTRVSLKLQVPGEFRAEVRPAPHWRVAACARLLDGLKNMLGADAVEVVYG
jgi:DNA polymerase-3 subunit alpha